MPEKSKPDVKRNFSRSVCSVQFGVALRPFRDYRDCQGREAQYGHLDFHTSPELWKSDISQAQRCFTSTETVRSIRDSGGT